MKRLLSAAAAVALLSLVGVLPALADGAISNGPWKDSRFDDAELRAGAKRIESSTLAVSGVFRYNPDGFGDRREIYTIKPTATGDSSICDALISDEQPASGSFTRNFSFSLSSRCNQTISLVVTAKTTRGPLGDPRRTAELSATVAIAMPVQPVADAAATVADTETKDVTVTWAFPENPAPDATYEVRRAGPDTDEEGWTTLADGITADDEPSLADTVEGDGAYRYRVIAHRPLVQPAVVHTDVQVGDPAPDGDDDEDDDDVDPDSSTTITQPTSTTPNPTFTSGSETVSRQVSTRTTVTTAPRATVTTIDTGFEETLEYDYESEDLLEDVEPGELAAEGQSVIGVDEDSIIGPGAVGASALVLIGWVGHMAYFRRLAAQF